jgi:hypothetical protein
MLPFFVSLVSLDVPGSIRSGSWMCVNWFPVSKNAMKTRPHEPKDRTAPWISAMVVILFVWALSRPAMAALGGTVDSVRADGVRMKATDNVVRKDTYAVHEMEDSTGTVVREYISNTGTVFGVSWRGPFVPDMRQILGPYFEQYSQAAKMQGEGQIGRHRLEIRDSGFVVQTYGHQRDYSGRAYDERLLPPAVGVGDLW